MKVDISVRELIDKYDNSRPDGHYFDTNTLKFFGERLSEMRIFKETVIIEDSYGEEHQCYILSSFQRKHPLGPRRKYSYFDVTTFDYVGI